MTLHFSSDEKINLVFFSYLNYFMRIAIIGTGFIANTHVEVLQSLGHEVDYVVHKTLEKAILFAKKWNIPNATTDYEKALANCEVIHLCTPPLAHYDYAKVALLAKKHVICEKPLTIEPQKAQELHDLATTQNVVGAVNFNVRYHPACTNAKQLIAQATFGEVRMIHGNYLQEFHAESDFYSWRYQTAIGGKMRATTEIGSHWVDLVRFWTGLEIKAVAANFANFQPTRYLTKDGIIHPTKQLNSQAVQIQSEDVATIMFKFSNGAIGNLVLSEVAHGRKNQLQLEVTGTHQSVWWNNEQPYQLHQGQKGQPVMIHNNPFGGGFTETFTRFFKAVYQKIENPLDKIDYPTFEDGYINASVCNAIFESATHESKWIKV